MLAIWTAVAVILTLIIVTTVWASLATMPHVLFGIDLPAFFVPWQIFVLMFFASLLILILPAYLLLFLVHRLSKPYEHEDN